MLILLKIHSILRWVIIIVGFAAILKFLIGISKRKDFGALDRYVSAAFSGLMDLQVSLGLLYFLVTGFSSAGFPLYRIEHLITMLLAAVIGHGPSFFKNTKKQHSTAFYSILGTMIIIVLGVYRLPGGWSR